jgi:hypothetical protein
MDEKLAIEAFITLRKEWIFYMNTGNAIKATETFRKMAELGNKYPQLARMVNTSRLGPAMMEAGFTANETGTAVGIIETTTAAETTGGIAAASTVGTAETTVAGISVSGIAMSVGAVIAIAVILGVAAFALYQFYKKQKEHQIFVNFARGKVGNLNYGMKPFLGRVH